MSTLLADPIFSPFSCAVFSSAGEPPMTMQIGMVGTDGIVLASDTWHSTTSGGVRHGYSSSKIMLNDTRQIAVTCALDMQSARELAKHICDMQLDPIRTFHHRVRTMSESVVGDHGFHCIIAVAGPFRRLYLFKFLPHPREIECIPIDDFVHAGDTPNAAVMWAMRYYKRTSMEALKGLAAQTVVSAHLLNTAMIDGLEIVCENHSGFYALPEDEKKTRQRLAHQRESRIGKLFT
jgi:hypothetical protein